MYCPNVVMVSLPTIFSSILGVVVFSSPDQIIPARPGTAWHYNMIEEAGPSARLSNESQEESGTLRVPVVYRIQGQREVDGRALLEFEMHRDGRITTTDLLTVDEHGMQCWARMDENGFIYLIDRKKEMILVSGFNVYPAEVESVLSAHPGIKEVVVLGIPSEQTGEAFIRGLVKDLGPLESICVGANFGFGHKRGGNVALLRRLGDELKFTVHGLADVSLDGKAVSSTRIREGIQGGRLDEVSQMLGRTYSLVGPVVRGDGLGRELGFPTANLEVRGLALPPRGVYAVHAEVAGKTWRAVLNIGFRPTLQNPKPQLQVEAHLLDFQGDLYGQELELKFVDQLRQEQQFASLAELRAQIARDIEQA